MQNILRIVLALFGVLFLVFGASFLFGVGQMLEMFALDPASHGNPALAWSTVRGDLGALFLTLGVAHLIGVLTNNKTWLQAAMLLLALIFIGRAVGLVTNGGDQQIYVNMGAEALGVILLWLYSRGID